MKILVAKLSIALLVVTALPSFAFAKASSTNVSNVSCDCYRVKGHTTNVHTFYLNPGHYHINLSGDGDTDLDLFAYSNGYEIARSVGGTDDEGLTLNIYWPGSITIKVRNLGHVYNDYQLSVR